MWLGEVRVPAAAYYLCLNLLATSSQPHTTISGPSIVQIGARGHQKYKCFVDVISGRSLCADVRLEVGLEVGPLEEPLPAQLATVATRLRATRVLIPLQIVRENQASADQN